MTTVDLLGNIMTAINSPHCDKRCIANNAFEALKSTLQLGMVIGLFLTILCVLAGFLVWKIKTYICRRLARRREAARLDHMHRNWPYQCAQYDLERQPLIVRQYQEQEWKRAQARELKSSRQASLSPYQSRTSRGGRGAPAHLMAGDKQTRREHRMLVDALMQVDSRRADRFGCESL